MDNLPSDPFILFSVVNMKLRNYYKSLKELCDDLGVSERELRARLASVGFQYDPATNQFR